MCVCVESLRGCDVRGEALGFQGLGEELLASDCSLPQNSLKCVDALSVLVRLFCRGLLAKCDKNTLQGTHREV